MEYKTIEISPLEFLGAFYDIENDEPIYIRVFNDKQRQGAQNFTTYAEEWGAMQERLKALNKENHGVFFVVNGGGQSDNEVLYPKAQFTEMDEGSFEEQFKKIDAFPLEPSIIVKTRKSLHCYWLLKSGKIESFRSIQDRFVLSFHGDAACINESRVMRIPGFYHCKQEPIMVECVKFNPELLYTQEQLCEVLPALPAYKQSNAVNLGSQIGEGSRNGTLFKLACALQAKGLEDESIIGALRTENKLKCKPPLSEREVTNVYRSAVKYSKGTVEEITAALSDDAISNMDARALIDCIEPSFRLAKADRARVQAQIKIRAKELRITGTVNTMLSDIKKERAEAYRANISALAIEEKGLPFITDATGKPAVTIDNFLLVMHHDSKYEGVRYNQLLNAPEVCSDGKTRQWCDTDEAASRHYIEATYGLYSERKHHDALRILFKERLYHPIINLINTFKWDGKERIGAFLAQWMKAEDSPYTSEVSRLIFAGGINRLFTPGCKFDDVPVLIGTHQGEGKSTVARWLAINDSYYSEVTEIDGQRGIEQLEGAWICEIAELLALTKAKEQEGIKAYISRQCDKYRKPYDIYNSFLPRQCIFIGTTNNEQFLKDKTGNRRFYPVIVHSSGYWLYEHEQECREYIIQCWAEAKVKYDKGEMPNFADKALLSQFEAAQEGAMEDDWRVGLIEDYLAGKDAGEYVCGLQLYREALSPNRDYPQNPTAKESQEIAKIMQRFDDWEKWRRTSIPGYGQQRCWRKKGMGEINREMIL